MSLLPYIWKHKSPVSIRADTRLNSARDTHARAWAFVMNSYAMKKAAPTSRQNDVKEVLNESRRTPIIPEAH